MKIRLRNTVLARCFTQLLRDHLDLIILSSDCQWWQLLHLFSFLIITVTVTPILWTPLYRHRSRGYWGKPKAVPRERQWEARTQATGSAGTRPWGPWPSAWGVYLKVLRGLPLKRFPCAPHNSAHISANKQMLLTLFASSWDSRVPVSLSKDLVMNQREMFMISEVSISPRQTYSNTLRFSTSVSIIRLLWIEFSHQIFRKLNCFANWQAARWMRREARSALVLHVCKTSVPSSWLLLGTYPEPNEVQTPPSGMQTVWHAAFSLHPTLSVRHPLGPRVTEVMTKMPGR